MKSIFEYLYFWPMKIFSTYLLMFILCLPILTKVATVLQWKWDQENIILTQCVNKNKPTLKCKGKCALMKRLDNIDQNAPSTTPNKILEFKLEVYLASQISDLIWTKTNEEINHIDNFSYTRWHSLLLTSSLFDPPDYIQA